LFLFYAGAMQSRIPAFAFFIAVRVLAQADNPLLVESALPYHLPAFDRLKEDHFAPAITQGISEQIREILAITQNREPPTFENTIVALERSGQLFARAQRTFMNLNATNTNPAMQQLQRELAPKFAAHRDSILLNGPLFARIQAVYDKRDRLRHHQEALYLLDRIHTDFVRAGAKLSEDDKSRLKEMNKDLAALHSRFAQNVLKERNASGILVHDGAELGGLSDAEIVVAATAAREEYQNGKFLLRLLNTTGQPPLASLQDRHLRERLMKVSLARNSHDGEFDNREIVVRIAQLRAERATLLGYATHADYELVDQTAGSVGTVTKMLAGITPNAVRNPQREAGDLQRMIKAEGQEFRLAAWDWPYYAEKLRKARYDFDTSQLRPYLELNRVLFDGVFFAATKEYGITFVERHDLPLYRPDVRIFEVFDADHKPLALFIGDYYARPSKNGGAWANAYVSQSKLLGKKPVVANHLNIPKPPAGEPTLLTWEEVRTAFHEFGHALHMIFSEVGYPRLARTPRDFVEFPSQVNEMWRDWPEVLRNYAKHYKTGSPMPPALLEKVRSAEQFNQGYRTTEYLAAAWLDLAWHRITPGKTPIDTVAFEAAALTNAGIALDVVPPRYRSTYFSHIFDSQNGYAAGYYSYVWSEVLDADSVEWFREHGGLTRENGTRFRTMVLSRGGSDDALRLYRAFVGREPSITPLLNRRGLK
jgi:peptidyl-dipeptidase Dcp